MGHRREVFLKRAAYFALLAQIGFDPANLRLVKPIPFAD